MAQLFVALMSHLGKAVMWVLLFPFVVFGTTLFEFIRREEDE